MMRRLVRLFYIKKISILKDQFISRIIVTSYFFPASANESRAIEVLFRPKSPFGGCCHFK